MTDISQEAHDALLKKAVDDAVAATEKALSTKTEEAASATSRVAELEKELEAEKAESTRLNKELDEAQVKLTAANDKAAELEKAAEKAEADRKVAEVASARTDQVKNLKLFPDEYVAEQASKWATLDDAAWDERLQEWAKLKPATSTEGAEDDKSSDAASAMTGTSEELTKEQQDAAAAGGSDTKTKSRRAVLGLV
jgi:chromosome segregation ATPase